MGQRSIELFMSTWSWRVPSLMDSHVTDLQASFLASEWTFVLFLRLHQCQYLWAPITASALPRICRETASHLTETSRHRLLPSKYLCLSREKGRSE